ncbi:hypothetical protein AM501_24070 [Aneurinibacillus migulanus]|uniref:hypothetical protein n=1 Tax=Aneurinibacillus migulanus TaxID=47500 RepID=UPI0005BDEE84|nr:hypothetical protein [Aneurinibacillus migulanus]KIV58914.1 hypothetical protein TS64_03910 [Aneurinibacillus migulanus]KPD05854.1 hypothetical protein AM501_24070 [Aneurinibacillus migulanus]
MKDYINLLKSLLKKGLIIAVVLYPILIFIQWLSPVYIAPIQSYHLALYTIYVNLFLYGDWILIILLSYKMVSSTNVYYEVAEKIRLNRLIFEFNRWVRTPYISPLHFFYLVSPQSSYSPVLKDKVFNRFYQKVIDLFRDRVFINASYETHFPEPVPTILQVLGKDVLLSVVTGVATLIGFFIYLAVSKDFSQWFTGFERFTIPFLVVISSWVGQYLYAMIKHGSGQDIVHTLHAYYKGEAPNITWRELFPDKPNGQIIIKAWLAERERRQRNFYYHQNLPLPADNNFVFNCPTLAPFPFPSNEIPDWAHEVESHYIKKELKQSNKQHKKPYYVTKMNTKKTSNIYQLPPP